MTNFWFIRAKQSTSQDKQAAYLREACEKRDITFVELVALDMTMRDVPVPEAGDMVYRTSSGRGKVIEKLMQHPGINTMYRTPELVFGERGASYFQNALAGLPVIPTYPLPVSSEAELHEAVEYLGDFPLICKVTGGTHGIGVIKVDSLESLRSIVDVLRGNETSFILRQFVPHEFQVRAVVVGEKVVASYAIGVPEGEFRTNTPLTGDSLRRPYQLSPEVEAATVASVTSVGLRAAGVDLLITSDGSALIAEVNFPFQFEYAQRITGVDIAGAIVDNLLE